MTVSTEITTGTLRRACENTVVRLRVLATSDLHAQLFPFNYFTDRRDDSVGLARLVWMIETARAEHPNTILVDNGDTLQGSPLGDAAVAAIMPMGYTHPMIATMNALRYDAATVGNHDFDFGIDVLNRIHGQARFPVVMANGTLRATRTALRPRHVIFERDVRDEAGHIHQLRIGLTGAAPPQIENWARAQLGDALEVEGILPAVAREVGLMRRNGADVVIVLGHTGIGKGNCDTMDENVGAAIAALPGVDALVTGHTHRIFPGRCDDTETECDGLISGTPTVQPGFWGSHLGVIDLTLGRRMRTGRVPPMSVDLAVPAGPPPQDLRGWEVALARGSVKSIADGAHAARRALRIATRHLPDLRVQMAQSHRLTRAYASRPLGQSAVRIESYFSQIAPCAATQIVADAQRAAIAARLADCPELHAMPLLSAVAPFKCGGWGGPNNYIDIEPGPLLLRHASDLYLYPNGLSVLQVDGALIRDWLERAASGFMTIRPDPDGCLPAQRLLDHQFASYNFDRIDGLRYSIDVSAPPRTCPDGTETDPGASRIRDVVLDDGTPVLDGAQYLVITNSYRADGGGHFDLQGRAREVLSLKVPVRDAVAEYIIRSNDALAPDVSPTWGFAPIGGTDVVFETGSGALGHPDRLKAHGLRHMGRSPATGFEEFLLKI